MPKLQYTKATDRYYLNIPKDMVERKKWQKGQSIYFIFNERGFIELQDQ